MALGVHSEVGRLRQVMVTRPAGRRAAGGIPDIPERRLVRLPNPGAHSTGGGGAVGHADSGETA